MLEVYSFYFVIAGLAVVILSYGWLIARAFRINAGWGIGLIFPPTLYWFRKKHRQTTRLPLMLLCVGALVAGAPYVVNMYHQFFVSFGAREKLVDGELHLTLTGWDEHDYTMILARPKTVVLQMANPDVGDDTMYIVKNLTELKELDVNDTKVTDEGLKSIAKLPKLERLRLRGTVITNAGFKKYLANLPTLVELDLRKTAVDAQTVADWKKAKEGRKVLR